MNLIHARAELSDAAACAAVGQIETAMDLADEAIRLIRRHDQVVMDAYEQTDKFAHLGGISA